MPLRARSSWVRRRLALVPVLLLVLGQFAGLSRSAQAQGSEIGVTTLTGSLVVTNPFVLDIFTEPYVLLNDLTNFVARDFNAPLPEFIQESAQLQGDLSDATYT